MVEMIEPVSFRPLLAEVPTMTGALERCFRLGGMSPSEAAYAVGVDYCHFQRMFRESGGRHFPPDLIVPLMVRARNAFPLHWLAHQVGGCVYPREIVAILDAIRNSLTAEGREALFALQRLGY